MTDQPAARELRRSTDDRMLAVGEENQVALWELSSGKLRTRLRGPHKGRVVSLSFSADGRRLVVTRVRPFVRHVLEITGVLDLLSVPPE